MYRTSFVPALVGVAGTVYLLINPSSTLAQQNDYRVQLRQMPLQSLIVDGRNYGGWQAAQPTQSAINNGPVVRASHYQQFSDLPNLSGGPAPSLPADSLVGAINDLREVPSQSNLGINGAPPMVNRNTEFDSQAAYNRENGVPQSDLGSSLGPGAGYDSSYNGAPNGNHGVATMQPSVNPSRVPVNFAAYQNGQPSVYPNQNGNTFPNQQLGQMGNGQVYPGPNGQPMMGNPTLANSANQFASGLPYVTPPPGQRFLTSPYLGPKNLPIRYTSYERNVAYQQPNPAVLPQNIQPPVSQPIYNPNNPGIYPTNYQCPDGAVGAYVPPTVTPNWNPSMYSANNSGYKPLFSLGQENYNVQLGRGLYGQPTVYVPGQPIRNFFRYIFP